MSAITVEDQATLLLEQCAMPDRFLAVYPAGAELRQDIGGGLSVIVVFVRREFVSYLVSRGWVSTTETVGGGQLARINDAGRDALTERGK